MQITYNNVPASMIKNQIFKYIHIFTDGKDEVVNIQDRDKDSYNDALIKAEEIKNNWIKEKITNIRMYFIHEEIDYRDGLVYQVEEHCIYSLGNYPY